jgi:hypothetical protein
VQGSGGVLCNERLRPHTDVVSFIPEGGFVGRESGRSLRCAAEGLAVYRGVSDCPGPCLPYIPTGCVRVEGDAPGSDCFKPSLETGLEDYDSTETVEVDDVECG